MDIHPTYERDTLRNTYLRLVPILGEDLLAKYVSEGIKIEGRKQTIKGAVIEGFRIEADINYLRRTAPRFMLIGILANPEIRFQRMVERRRVGEHLDRHSFDEIEKKEGPWVEKSLKQADHVLTNEGSADELNLQITKLVEEYLAE